MPKVKTDTTKEEPKVDKRANDFVFANGRRKTASARARLHPFSADILVGEKKLERGDIYVNNQKYSDYFHGPYAKQFIEEIYRTTNSGNRFITTVVVGGSGSSGQLGAVGLAISKALVKVDPKFKQTLRKKGYMTRDPRSREREKPGLMGARKEKQSPKR